jgi:hypothetical protein
MIGQLDASASPESRHSLSIPFGSASSRLRGISLMLMELLTRDEQNVADLTSDDQKDDFLAIDIPLCLPADVLDLSVEADQAKRLGVGTALVVFGEQLVEHGSRGRYPCEQRCARPEFEVIG